MSEKQCCGTCQYGDNVEELYCICVNGDSDYCAEYVGCSYCCEDWEGLE